jgi:aryl-alcohol dehydrogenase-like predicted oxidoreductase
MERRRLGKTDLELSRIGFGAWGIAGAGWAYSWGPQDEDVAVAAIRRALELGVNWIDTAAVYGFGHSEELVARALRGLEQRPYVFTKCGNVWDEAGTPSFDLGPASLRRELEQSLRRLETDVIDLYQIHWPIPDERLEEGWETLAGFVAEGKVRHIGVSNFDVAQLERMGPIAPVAALQPPYSLLNRGIEDDVLPYCERNGIGVIVYSPLQSGLLSGTFTRERLASLPEGDWRKSEPHYQPDYQEPLLSRNLELVARLRPVAERRGWSLASMAVAWTLRQPAVTGAIVGFRRPEHVEGIVAATDLQLTTADLAAIDACLG